MLQVAIGDDFTLGEGGPGIGSSDTYETLGGLITTILPNVMIVANIILFFLIVFGGLTMIANAGNAEKQAQGAQVLTTSLVGFLIIFGSYWIMQILGIITGYGFLDGFVSGL